MDIEYLAQLAKGGDREAMAALWLHVKPRACGLALRRYLRLAEMNGGMDADDLKQMAALGVVLAVDTYSPGECPFEGWMAYYIRRCCRQALGLTGRARAEHYRKTSMDAPLPDMENATLADALPDENAPDPCAMAELDGLRHDVLAAVERLPQPGKSIIRRCDLQGEPRWRVAQALGIPAHALAARRRSGLLRLRRHLWAYAPDYSRHKSLAAFNTTWSSVVEDEVIRREGKHDYT